MELYRSSTRPSSITIITKLSNIHQAASVSAQKRSTLPDLDRTSALCMRCAAHFGSCNPTPIFFVPDLFAMQITATSRYRAHTEQSMSFLACRHSGCTDNIIQWDRGDKLHFRSRCHCNSSCSLSHPWSHHHQWRVFSGRLLFMQEVHYVAAPRMWNSSLLWVTHHTILMSPSDRT